MRMILTQLEPPGRAAGAVFAAAVLLTLLSQAVLAVLPQGLQMGEASDYHGVYLPVAHNILAGRGITVGAGVPAISTPPGYPLVLAGLLGLSGLLNLSDGFANLALACVAMGICSVLVYAVARSVCGPAPALVAPLIWMTCPFVLWLTRQPGSETPFLVAFYGAFGLFWYALIEPRGGGYRRYFLTGILVGVAALIRPVAIGAGLAFGAVLWLARWDLSARLRLGFVTALLLGNLAAVFPWEAWVYRQTGRVVPLGTIGGSSMRDGLVFALDAPEYHREMKVPASVKLLMQDAAARSREFRSYGDLLGFMAGQVRERPIAVGELMALKVARSWYGTDTGRHEAAIVLIQALYVAVVLWATLAAWERGETSRQLAVAVWVMVLYFWVMAALVVPLLRYMVPAIGLLFVLLPMLIMRAPAASRPPVAAGATGEHT